MKCSSKLHILLTLSACVLLGGCSQLSMSKDSKAEDDGERTESIGATWTPGAQEPVKQPSYYDPNVPPPQDAVPQKSQ